MDFNSYCFEPNEVFTNRNKAYGAFWLRKVYNKRLTASLCVGAVVFSMGVAGPVIYKGLGGGKTNMDDLNQTVVNLADLEPPPLQEAPPPPEIPPPPPPPKVETVRFVPPEPAPDEEVPDEEMPPPQDSLKDVQAADITQEGDPNADLNTIIVEDPPPPVVQPPPPKDEVFTVVEQMPTFPGGLQAMYEWMQKEFEYPEIARKAGVEGKVFVQFVVGNDGAIRDAQVVRGIGGGCDEEALRLIKAMPKWIPGKQNGRAVSVKFSMPITFKLK
ncbi:MAG TPA: TonB family protein [Rhodothermales bacterium]|nr:TonB family protein [Rhodothermales bacterium]